MAQPPTGVSDDRVRLQAGRPRRDTRVIKLRAGDVRVRIAILVSCALAIGCGDRRPAISLRSIEPAVVPAFVDTPVTLRGSGFAAAVMLKVDDRAPPKV